MEKNLIIVESPAKARTISKFLNNKYDIVASMGHVRDLPKRDMGIDVENHFTPKYVTDRSKSSIIKELRAKASKAPIIYLASDHDREGEAIAWHLKELLKKQIKDKPVYRITFNEITKKAIKESLKEPGKIDLQKVDAQQARRMLDRIVGYKVSPVLWKVIAKNLSAGRVQSVALRLICEKEEQITKFEPQEYWKVFASFWKDNCKEFVGELVKYDAKKVDLSNEKMTNDLLSEIKNLPAKLTNISKSKRNVQPYAPYITSTMQQDASKIAGFSPKRTMHIAQELYEGIKLGGEQTGLITYMRTDSLRISSEAQESCRNLIVERYGKDKLNSVVREFKNKNKSQDAHEAIRPTNVYNTPDIVSDYLSKEQLRLYTLIWERFVATQMIAMIVESIKVSVKIGKSEFLTRGARILEKGFTLAYNHVSTSLGEIIDFNYGIGDDLFSKNFVSEQKFTQPPSRFSEASLIKELEAKEIGRPSTYASIISTILDRNYVNVNGKILNPTELGEKVNSFLTNKFDSTFNVNFTAEMEKRLDEIESGNNTLEPTLAGYYDSLVNLISQVDTNEEKKKFTEHTDIKCEDCSEGHYIVKRSRRGEFLGCSNYPECKSIRNFKREEDGSITILRAEKLDEKCPDCGSDLILKNGRYGKFIACTNYPKCKFTKPLDLGIKCPKCDDGMITEKRSGKGRVFYSCTNYPKCDFSTWNKPVKVECPDCGNYYMEEKNIKGKGLVQVCPKCGKEIS